MPVKNQRGPRRKTVAVIGGGISGLAAAWELTGGSNGPDATSPQVVLLEADARLGGKIATGSICGQSVDVGPDGFLGRRREAELLCREVGLGDALVPIAANGASLWARGRLRPLPDGLALGVPTRFWPLLRSGILSKHDLARVLLDIVSPRPDTRNPLGDRAVGPLVARKLGTAVVDSLVDPLIGGIHAGTVSDMSAAAVFPMLLAVGQSRGSLMKALRRAVAKDATPTGSPDPTEPPIDVSVDESPESGDSDPGDSDPGDSDPGDSDPGDSECREGGGAALPAFWSLDGGLQSLVARLVVLLEERGVTIRTASSVDLIDRQDPRTNEAAGADGPTWVLHSTTGPVEADGVIVTSPAPEAARLIGPHSQDAATLLNGIDYASVSIVTISYLNDAFGDRLGELRGTGGLIPRHSLFHLKDKAEHYEALTTAFTYLSAKWPNLAREGEVLIRASVGRWGDDRPLKMSDSEIVSTVVSELATVLAIEGAPREATVTRWQSALPQYRVHHLLRVAGINSALSRLPSLAVAGAAYNGIGIPACIASGRNAARSILQTPVLQGTKNTDR